jgi:hypothetical protein
MEAALCREQRDGVSALAFGDLDGTPVAVTGGPDQALRLWSRYRGG